MRKIKNSNINNNTDIAWVERIVHCFERSKTQILVCMSNFIRTLMIDPYYAKKQDFVEGALRILCALSYEQQIAAQGEIPISLRDRYQMRAILRKELSNS